jgi:hypothetical protein
MGWGSIISTVGNVVGQLINNFSAEDGILAYRLRPDADVVGGASTNFDACFGKDPNGYYVFNNSTKPADDLVLSFPGNNAQPGETLTIPSTHKSCVKHGVRNAYPKRHV